MRAAAGLNRRHRPRVTDVADVEDAHAAEPLSADRVHHSLRSTIETAANFLDRHEEQIAVDRRIALPTGTDNR
jgi:hypothetical protein